MGRQKLKSRGTSFSPEGLNGKDFESVALPFQSKKPNKKRTASVADHTDKENVVENDCDHREHINGGQVGDDLNEPTMGDKLASINLLDTNGTKSLDKEESSHHGKPPSADSVHVLLKQALRANDQALILNCLYTQDKKVITNSISLLNISDALMLLDSLITLIQSRGAVLVCALPWLRSLLLQHASGIMSQDSSVTALNSMYQLIESRISTFNAALQLSSCLDLVYKGSLDDDLDEINSVAPIVYEDKDESEDEESDAMETDHESDDPELFIDSCANYESDEMGLTDK